MNKKKLQKTFSCVKLNDIAYINSYGSLHIDIVGYSIAKFKKKN